MNDALILDQSWPEDLDPDSVPFATRTETVLRRCGLYGDPSRFNTLTVAEVSGWWNTGPGTIADLRDTAHAAIRRHHAQEQLRARINDTLEKLATEPWARTVWRRDPRFFQHLPRTDATVYDIATAASAVDRRFLFDHLDDLRAAIDRQAVMRLDHAIAEYVSLITGQHDERLDVLLARTGLSGDDPITGAEAGRRLGVSYQRIYQLEKQLQGHRNRAMPPGGIWMPQVDSAAKAGWTETAVDRATAFIAPHT